MKKILFIAICAVFVGCSSMSTIHNTEKVNKMSSMAYITPVFIIKKSNKEYRSIKNFKKYANRTVDSLFTVDAEKYKISKKIALNAVNLANVETMFTENVVSNDLKTYLKNTKEKHVMCISLKPTLSYVTDKIQLVKSSKMEVIIIESATGTIIFRDRFHSSGNGLKKQLFRNLEKLYAKLDK